jgi:hypothetical protein
MVLTSGDLLVAKITSLDGMLYGMVTYVTDDGAPRYWGTWTHFLGQTWQRTLNLPSPLYEPLITARQPSALVQRLGRIARIDPATIVATMSAQDPVLLAEYAKVLDLLAAWCGVDQGAFGIYGSAMYKPTSTTTTTPATSGTAWAGAGPGTGKTTAPNATSTGYITTSTPNPGGTGPTNAAKCSTTAVLGTWTRLGGERGGSALPHSRAGRTT